MFNHRRYLITLVALTVVLSAHSAQGQVKAKRDRAPETTKKESAATATTGEQSKASVSGHAQSSRPGPITFQARRTWR